MNKINIFKNCDENEKKQILSSLQSRCVNFKKERTISSFLSTQDYIGIILQGEADLVRYDYNGSKTIIEHLDKDNIFGGIFTPNGNNELYVIATKDCQVAFIDYENIIKSTVKGSVNSSIFIDNLLKSMAGKLIDLNKRIEILSQRSTREKLLTYFNQVSSEKGKKTFNIGFSFTDLADYLGVDRSAMSREIKNLKDEKLIKVIKKEITILYEQR